MTELRPYQRRIADAIVQNEATAVFLDPGLGKTLTVLTALNELDSVVLILGPIRVIETVWMQESRKWNIPFDFSLVRGSPKERLQKLKPGHEVYMTNFENMDWFFKNWKPEKGKKLTLVVDESTFLKDPSSKRFKALKPWLKEFSKRIILTGTPIPNTYLELWSQIGILDSGKRLEKVYGKYKSKYFHAYFNGTYTKHTITKEGKEIIPTKIKDIVHRIDASDYITLPKIIESERYVDMCGVEAQKYKDFENDCIADFEDEEITALTAGVLHGKLSQLANGFIYTPEKEAIVFCEKKWEELEALYEELNGKNFMVVYKFQYEITRLRKLFGSEIVFLKDGKTEDIVDRWNEGKIRILALHPKSGGHGLNLQYGGSTIIYTCPLYSGEDYVQTVKRLARSGQEFVVNAITLKTRNTVDEAIQNNLDSKLDNQAAFLKFYKEKKK